MQQSETATVTMARPLTGTAKRKEVKANNTVQQAMT